MILGALSTPLCRPRSYPRDPRPSFPVPFPLCNAKRRGYIALTNLCSRFYDSGKWPLVSMSCGSVTLLRPTNKEANRRFPARCRKLHSARATPRHPPRRLPLLPRGLFRKTSKRLCGSSGIPLSFSRGDRVSPPRARSVMCTPDAARRLSPATTVLPQSKSLLIRNKAGSLSRSCECFIARSVNKQRC